MVFSFQYKWLPTIYALIKSDRVYNGIGSNNKDPMIIARDIKISVHSSPISIWSPNLYRFQWGNI